ncbi:MAG: hypothetical protein SFU98_08610 [Leptospiraceae bacterium]|nr:hypothetical protein [Leptospiraceae bacterium]
MKTIFYFIIILSLGFGTNCLRPKKSLFDLSSPGGLIIGFGYSNSFNNKSDNSNSTANNTVGVESVTISNSYPNTNWMDYVRRNMSSPSSISQTGTACDGTETGWYNSCIHAGEIKRFELKNQTSCADITASDTLGAFNWICSIQGGKVYVYSVGLKENKNLSDLIDFTNAVWLDNSITARKSGTIVATSTASKWWTNPIQIQNVSTILATSGTIYIVNTNVTANYTINNSRLALVVKPGNIVTGSGAGSTVTYGTNVNFNWLEGNFTNGTTNMTVINMPNTSKFAVLRNVSTFKSNAGTQLDLSLSGAGLYLYNVITSGGSSTNSYSMLLESSNAMIKNLNVSNNPFSVTSAPIINVGSDDNILLGVTVFNNGTSNFAKQGSVNKNFYQNFSLNNANNSTSLGSFDLGDGDSITVQNLLSSNNAEAGIRLESNAKFRNTIAAHNDSVSSGNIRSMGGMNEFNGILKVSSGNCTIGAGSPGYAVMCAKASPSELTPATEVGANLANTFVGKVLSNDTKNSADANGLGTPSTDPYNFENIYRGWGADGGNYPVAGNRGACLTGCRIWDWSLKATDSQARSVNDCPNGALADTHTFSTGNVTFLRNAMEILYDGVGNDNGICESNEDCIWTPNIGSYQGHGDLIKGTEASTTPNDKSCADIGAGGTIQNVKIYKYKTNGY